MFKVLLTCGASMSLLDAFILIWGYCPEEFLDATYSILGCPVLTTPNPKSGQMPLKHALLVMSSWGVDEVG